LATLITVKQAYLFGWMTLITVLLDPATRVYVDNGRASRLLADPAASAGRQVKDVK
jgi:hypothetical protein